MSFFSSELTTSKHLGFDIFSGAGGMSVGAEMAGINITHAIENDIPSAQTYEYNHFSTTVLKNDIRKINPENLVDSSPFILFGGPPCQGFSLSNTKTRHEGNPNNLLFKQFIHYVDVLKPEWFVFENVEGIESYGEGSIVRYLENIFDSLGYTTEKKVLCASDYGVPQNRNRFFLIGNRKSIEYIFPEPKSTKVTVGDAILDLPDLNNGSSDYSLEYKSEAGNEYAKLMRFKSESSLQNFVSRNKDYVIERYRYIRQGQNWRSIPEELMRNYAAIEKTHSGIYKRLSVDQPSVVISNYRKNMLIHPIQDRGLSVREAARIQSFPDTFVFQGPLTHIQQQIGNAVPPLLAYAIFKSILKLNNNERAERKHERSVLEV